MVISEEIELFFLACFLTVCTNMATANGLATVQSVNPNLT